MRLLNNPMTDGVEVTPLTRPGTLGVSEDSVYRSLPVLEHSHPPFGEHIHRAEQDGPFRLLYLGYRFIHVGYGEVGVPVGRHLHLPLFVSM